MSLNKNSIYCVMLRSSKNADQRKQWWYRVAGYSAVAPFILYALLSFFSVLFCHVFIYKVVLFIIIYDDTAVQCKLSPKVKNAKMCHMCI